MSTQALPAVADSAPVIADKVADKASFRTTTRTSKAIACPNAAVIGQLKRLYNTDQQTEYLFIQAEADSLLVQLERLKSKK